jgi:DNA mismatch endonuclease (patch repair protein)
MLTAERRSENMRRIRSRDTSPEMIVRKIVHSLGYRFRLHRRDLPGRPDVVLPRLHKVILVHGCFFHQHNRCIDGRLPESRAEYWVPKLARNVKRDRVNRARLTRTGWSSLVIWECETKKPSKVTAKIQRFIRR